MILGVRKRLPVPDNGGGPQLEPCRLYRRHNGRSEERPPSTRAGNQVTDRRAYSSIKEELFLARLAGGGLSDAGGYHLGHVGEDTSQLEG